MAIFAERIAPRDPQQISEETFRPPSLQFLFGTDDLGRDVFSGVVRGARTSIIIGVTVALSSTLLGVLIGLTAGYAGGLLDDILMRVTELFLIPPRFLLALVVAALFGSNLLTLVVVLCITYWPGTARLIRSEVLSIRERTFVEAARAIGASPARIVFHEILPNLFPLIVTNFALMVSGVMLVEAGLSFIGLGDANHISWGYMLHNGQHFIRQAWWMILFPTLALSSLVFALNTVGDALNHALDPRSRIEHLDKNA
jgi:peptide/nickel transport system permease protein